MTALIEPDQENILTVLWRGLRWLPVLWKSPLDGDSLINHFMDRCLKCKHEMEATYKEVYKDM
jgi:hypothetical protein